MKNKFWNKNKVTAVLFVFVLFMYAVFNELYVIQNKDKLVTNLKNEASIENKIKSINDFVNDNVYMKYPLIEGYGAIQKILLKHEFNSFDKVIDKQGYLFGGNFYNNFGGDQRDIAFQARKLKEYSNTYGAEFSFVVTPMKTVLDKNAYLGIPYNDYTSKVHELLRGLRYYSVPYLDLSATLNLNYEDTFYKGDHHWKTAAAFKGYQDIINWLEQTYQVILDGDGKTTNINNYTKKVYSQLMFGSQSRDVGKIYGLDGEDFELLYPKDNGSYTVDFGTVDNYQRRNGGFDDALLLKDIEKKITNIYKDSCYDLAFLHGLSSYIRITNNNITQAPKILMIRDSYSSPLGCFMAQNFSQIDMVYILGPDKDKVLKMIKDNHYDYVMMCIYPENLAFENLKLFDDE